MTTTNRLAILADVNSQSDTLPFFSDELEIVQEIKRGRIASRLQRWDVQYLRPN